MVARGRAGGIIPARAVFAVTEKSSTTRTTVASPSPPDRSSAMLHMQEQPAGSRAVSVHAPGLGTAMLVSSSLFRFRFGPHKMWAMPGSRTGVRHPEFATSHGSHRNVPVERPLLTADSCSSEALISHQRGVPSKPSSSLIMRAAFASSAGSLLLLLLLASAAPLASAQAQAGAAAPAASPPQGANSSGSCPDCGKVGVTAPDDTGASVSVVASSLGLPAAVDSPEDILGVLPQRQVRGRGQVTSFVGRAPQQVP